MLERVDKLEFVRERAPLSANQPATLVEVYLRVQRDHRKPDTLNFKRDGSWHSLSAQEMGTQARAIALGLYSLGVRKGDRVALLSESRVEWVLADQGCIFAGAVTVPIYPTLTSPQVAYILKDCGPRVIFVSTRGKFEEIESAFHECASLEHLVLFDAHGLSGANRLSFAELQARGGQVDVDQPKLIDELSGAAKPDDLATIIYTSGTTGDARRVMLRHSNMVSNLMNSSKHL